MATQGRWTTPGTLAALGVNLSKHSFYIALTGQFEAIVGLPRLQKIALSIDWSQGLLLLRNSRRYPYLTTASVASADSKISPEYADYASLFNKKAADVPPAHQEWDDLIPLEEEKLPPYGPIYVLMPIEVKALPKKVNKNLQQEFIQPSTLPAGALILFVKKKDEGL